ncbi:hypothetical protein [Hymenobacter metallicola]|uniref:Uncharacterized protein n=1 Tax=Hymenobacter metallicola TaxID=2563114 RepID=A0A4Z0QKS3_9BACT|nr:hypothetical protein [Hymenobacter metallicola]TGE29843.1 hypothetical protein E5K02_10390 [Hymenobacter metallicola]
MYFSVSTNMERRLAIVTTSSRTVEESFRKAHRARSADYNGLDWHEEVKQGRSQKAVAHAISDLTVIISAI